MQEIPCISPLGRVPESVEGSTPVGARNDPVLVAGVDVEEVVVLADDCVSCVVRLLFPPVIPMQLLPGGQWGLSQRPKGEGGLTS